MVFSEKQSETYIKNFTNVVLFDLDIQMLDISFATIKKNYAKM